MTYDSQVVIVGGGIMGVSLAYHLTRRGWRDVLVLERSELTAGSTWHAAGLCTHFAHNFTIMQMRAASARLYRDLLPAETGETTGFHPCGALRVTRSEERMAEFRHVQGLGQFMGYEFRILSPEELVRIYPLARIDGLLGAFHEPNDGHVDPALATHAMAAGARARGAEIRRHEPVRSVELGHSGAWVVHTDRDVFRCEHVVNAAGIWCREIGAMMGIDLPVVPILHQYLVTGEVSEIVARTAEGAPELPMIRDPDESWYLRQEHHGFILGPYEAKGCPWGVDGIPPEFGMDLLPPDLDRVEPIVALAMERVPALSRAGIKIMVNGPITFTPDANPLVGPAFGLDNAWLLTGSSMGIMEGGGAGQFLADWIVDGAPPIDPLAVDPRRFGGYADRDYRVAKATECFGLQYGVHYPFEERPAGRPRHVTPIYDAQEAGGAVFGCAYGWERPNWFATQPGRRTGLRRDSGSEPHDDPRDATLTFRRPAWWETVAEECRAVRDRVGLADLSALSKFEVSGADASTFMERLGANRPPGAIGRIGLTHVLTAAGGVAAEFTVTRLAADRYYLTSAAVAQRHAEDVLRRHAAGFGGVAVVNCTEDFGILGLMGPEAPIVLEALTATELDHDAFPWLSARMMRVAGVNTRALRISYVGECGWELHAAMADLPTLYDALCATGAATDLRAFGAYAMNSLRLEKGYRAWGSDLTAERTPFEAGLDYLVRTDGREFTGREALLARSASLSAWRMELLRIEPDGDADPFYDHTVWRGSKVIGIVTSAAPGHRTGTVLALAYFRPEAGGIAGGAPSTEMRSGNVALEVSILGRRCAARILDTPPYDPTNARLRGAAEPPCSPADGDSARA